MTKTGAGEALEEAPHAAPLLVRCRDNRRAHGAGVAHLPAAGLDPGHEGAADLVVQRRFFEIA